MLMAERNLGTLGLRLCLLITRERGAEKGGRSLGHALRMEKRPSGLLFLRDILHIVILCMQYYPTIIIYLSHNILTLGLSIHIQYLMG